MVFSGKASKKQILNREAEIDEAYLADEFLFEIEDKGNSQISVCVQNDLWSGGCSPGRSW